MKIFTCVVFIFIFSFTFAVPMVFAADDFEYRMKRLPDGWYTPRAVEHIPTINIRPLLRSYTNDVWHLFGNETHSFTDVLRRNYHFDTGVSIGLEGYAADNVPILSIRIDFYHDDYRFHFDEINLMSTYEDIVNTFGFHGGRREEYGNRGAAFSYVYTYSADGWAGFADDWGADGLRFYFADDYTLVHIMWFQPV